MRFSALAPMMLLLAVGLCSKAVAQTEANLLSTLRPGHPRLIVLDDRIEQTRQRLATDPVLRKYLDQIRRDAQRFAKAAPVKHELAGPRLLGESRKCLDRVYAFAILYRLEGERRWVDCALRELEAAAAFPDWNPSHFLDVAEMTHAFAIGYDWLYPALNDDQRAMIRNAIVEKGLKPGLEAYGGARFGWWRRAHHNWNQVCNGGLVLGALAVADEEPELARQILDHALKSLPNAMKSFAPDGGWAEGPGYWDYTLRYTMPLILGLESALGHDAGLGRFEGLADTGSFRLHIVGPTGMSFNYADAGTNWDSGGRWGMYALGRRFDRPAYHRGGGAKPWGLGLFFHEPPPATLDGLEPLDRLFRGVNVVCMRSSWSDPAATYVGFKGGDNRANHSHLDLGTFVFDALGQRWVLELGPDNYNLPAYFGKQRWTYYRLNTHGQNAPLLDDQNQDPAAKSAIIGFRTGAVPAAVADLTAAYPDKARRLWRGVFLVHDRRGLLVQDELEAEAPVAYTWQMHTQAAIEIHSPIAATLTLGGQRLHARLLSDGTFAVRDAAAPPPQDPNEGVRKLVVELPQRVKKATVAVLLSPIEDPVAVEPLQRVLDTAAE